MAEAIAAAGLASSIITFIEASVKLAGICKEFYDNCGELPRELAKCQRLVDEFYLWVSDLQRSISIPGQQRAPNHADDALQRVIARCVIECESFQKLLISLLPPTNRPSRGPASLAALKSALRTIHKEGKIKRLQQSLESLKNDLRLCIGERTMRLSEEACNQNQQIINDGQKAVERQATGQKELVAYLVDHGTRIEDMSCQMGWLEVDVRRTNQKSDEMLLLVRELAASINSQKTNTAIICINVPRSLYDPSISIFKGFRAYTQRLPMPGSWVPSFWDLRSSQRQVHASNGNKRIAFVAIGSEKEEVEDMDFQPEEVATGSMMQYKEVYRRRQNWIPWLFCFEVNGAVLYPVVKPVTQMGGASGGSSIYKVWSDALDPPLLEDSLRTPGTKVVGETQVESEPQSIAVEHERATPVASSPVLQQPKSTRWDQEASSPRPMAGDEASLQTTDVLQEESSSGSGKMANHTSDSTFQQTVQDLRSTFASSPCPYSQDDLETIAGSSTWRRHLRARASFDSYLDNKAQERMRNVSPRNRSAIDLFRDYEHFRVQKSSLLFPEITLPPLASNPSIKSIECDFLGQQRNREARLSEVKRITKILKSSTSLTLNSDTIRDIQTVVNTLHPFRPYLPVGPLPLRVLNSKNDTLAEIITSDLSAAEAVQKPFHWGIKLVEEQNCMKLFSFQFAIGVGALFFFEPWRASWYQSLISELEQFFATSYLNYHGSHHFFTVFLCRIFCADLLFEPWMYGFQSLDTERRAIAAIYHPAQVQETNIRYWIIVRGFVVIILALMNMAAFIAFDFWGFRFCLDFFMLFFWKVCLFIGVIPIWAVASVLKISYRGYQLSHAHVFFLLACLFLIADMTN